MFNMLKDNKKILRLKYIRVLERFVKRAISLLKHKDFDLDFFKKAIATNYKIVEKTTPVRLNSQYLQKLEQYKMFILNSIEKDSKDFVDTKEFLLKEANLLHKEKNKNNYKKNKHKKTMFNDGY
jgi:hypothetical protein